MPISRSRADGAPFADRPPTATPMRVRAAPARRGGEYSRSQHSLIIPRRHPLIFQQFVCSTYKIFADAQSRRYASRRGADGADICTSFLRRRYR